MCGPLFPLDVVSCEGTFPSFTGTEARGGLSEYGCDVRASSAPIHTRLSGIPDKVSVAVVSTRTYLRRSPTVTGIPVVLSVSKL